MSRTIVSVQDVISSNDIVLITKSNCSFCDKLKEFLVEIGIPKERIVAVNIQTQQDRFQDLAEELASITTCFTFPQLFVKQQYLGGYSDLKNAFQFRGDFLQKVFKEVGINIVNDF